MSGVFRYPSPLDEAGHGRRRGFRVLVQEAEADDRPIARSSDRICAMFCSHRIVCAMSGDTDWPPLPYPAWKSTCETLHLWTQITGKIRLALTPWLNHSWHVPLYVTSRGLSTSVIPYKDKVFEIQFDFIDQTLDIDVSTGQRTRIQLMRQPVCDFYAAVMQSLADLGIGVQYQGAALRNSGRDLIQRRSHPRILRSRRRTKILAGTGPSGSCVQEIPCRVYRQGKPGSFFLG